MRTLILFLTGLVLLVTAPAALAGQVTLDGSTLVFRGGSGEVNQVSVRASFDDTLLISDARQRPTAATDACQIRNTTPDTAIDCDPARFSAVRVETLDGADQIDVANRLPSTVQAVEGDGGAGDDQLSGPTSVDFVGVTFRGGDGVDKLSGGDGADVLEGGAGNDDVSGNDGDDQVRGGDGDDLVIGELGADVIDGGAGFDQSKNDWTGASTITVTLDGVADDGRAGEGDNVISVEHQYAFVGGTYVAGSEAVRFEVIQSSVPVKMTGGPGADWLRTYDYADEITGGAGNDTIEAGNGDDVVDPGPGQDTVNTEAGPGSCNFLVCRGSFGNDTVNARDGERDSIECGDGADRVVADAIDQVASTCETVERPADGGPGQPGPGPGPETGGGGGADKRCVVPKVAKGTTLASARRRLKAAGCKAGVRKQRSSVRRGRVIGLARRSGKRLVVVRTGAKLAAATTVVVRVSSGRR